MQIKRNRNMVPLWVGMVLVSHLKPHEEGGRVTLGQLRGSGSIAQLSDIVIGLERNQQSEEENNKSDLISGNTGPAGSLQYNPETGRMIDTSCPFGDAKGEY